MSKIIFCISSGIAAIKIPQLLRLFAKKNHSVQVICTENASRFISIKEIEKITGNSVYKTMYEADFSVEQILKQKKVKHIELAKSADMFIIAPATANTIAKLAAGIADDLITTSVLATTAPVLVCPSMNTMMWQHPATQENLRKLESYGYEILKPGHGSLACGTVGLGRLPDANVIEKCIATILSRKHILKDTRILITGGGTVEDIDDARVITNRSSGKMGKALAEAAYRFGANVTYLRSTTALPSYLPIKQILFQSSQDLSKLFKKHIKKNDICIHSAAVSDFYTHKIDGKIDSSSELNLQLKKNKKIIHQAKVWNPTIFLVSFKAVSLSKTQTSSEKNAIIQKKVEGLVSNSGADYTIVNDISRKDVGFESDENEVMIYKKTKMMKFLPKNSKRQIAELILQTIFKS